MTIPDPENKTDISFSPSACLLLDGLDKRWNKFYNQLERCQQEFSEEGVHDLRVAARRLMAMVDMCDYVAPVLKHKGLRRNLKSLLDDMDNLRDTQVMILFIEKNFKKNPSAVPFLAYLKLEELHLIRKADKDIQKLVQEKFSKQIQNVRARLEKALNGKDVGRNILSAVDQAFVTAIWRKVSVNRAEVSTIHKLRISFKKFRYMVEVASPITPGMSASRMKVMQSYQGMMGNIQDMEVMLAELDGFAAKNPAFDISTVRAFVAQKLEERITLFLSHINRIDRFWRNSPSAKFPWKPAPTEGQG